MHRRRPQLEKVETGVAIYNKGALDEVDDTPTAYATVSEAINIHNNQLPSRDVFNGHRRIKPSDIKLHTVTLEPGVDPHPSIREWAKTCLVNYGSPIVASIDTSKSAISNRASDMADCEVRRYHKNHLGLVIFVEQQEEENPSHLERIARLKTVVAELTRPAMTVVTVEATEVPNPMPHTDIASGVELS